MAESKSSGRPGSAAFSASASAGLAPVAGQVEQAKRRAEIGGLRLDVTAANALLAKIAQVKTKVDGLVRDCGDLDQPLRFGDNWVGELVAERLRRTAVGPTGGVTPVLKEFARVLGDLEVTVRAAAGRYVAADEESARAMERAAARFGLQVEV